MVCDRLPYFQLNLFTSSLGRVACDQRFGMDDVSVAHVRNPSLLLDRCSLGVWEIPLEV